MKLLIFTHRDGVMGTKTRIFHENGTEIECLAGIAFEPDAGGLMRTSLSLIGAELVRVDCPPENTAQKASDALRELVAAKQMREEVLRRKQRRLCSIERNPKEVRAVAKLHEECKVRESRAWNVARSIIAKGTV